MNVRLRLSAFAVGLALLFAAALAAGSAFGPDRDREEPQHEGGQMVHGPGSR